MELALKHKGNLAVLGSLAQVRLREGPPVGAVWTLATIARRLGLEQALGRDFPGQLALWQVLARVLDQGSRLSAVRLAPVHAACDVLGIRRGFDENDLHQNLTWLSQRQEAIERRLFALRRGRQKPELFLYDVTSSCLEGVANELADYGYGRDGKKGKKQIVIGLLCDEQGEPVSTEVFRGHTRDRQTFASQVDKAADWFGCERVTFVGDRGMIKRAQRRDLREVGFPYLTAITKPEVEALLKEGVLQMELFSPQGCEVDYDGVRLVLRRNPHRAEQMAASRQDKHASVERLLAERNRSLQEHPRAQGAAAEKKVRAKIQTLKIDRWLQVEAAGRTLRLRVDEQVWAQISRLDGCYVIQTDLPAAAATAQVVHGRYKDLALVEQAFRTCKTVPLETRPIHVRKEENTRGHVLVVMLGYLIRRELQRAWAPLDVTVEEGLQQLQTLCAIEIRVDGGGSCLQIPAPRPQSRDLLNALDITLPEALPHTNARAVTRKKLPQRRQL
jgi:hypothetical protein